MRRLRGCLAAVGAVALCLAALAGGIWYRVEVAPTEVLTDVSPDGMYEFTIDRVGEPDWPFGATHCRFTLRKEGRQILERAFSIQDDGAVARADNFAVRWRADGVQVTVSGSEQGDRVYVLGFDGSAEESEGARRPTFRQTGHTSSRSTGWASRTGPSARRTAASPCARRGGRSLSARFPSRTTAPWRARTTSPCAGARTACRSSSPGASRGIGSTSWDLMEAQRKAKGPAGSPAGHFVVQESKKIRSPGGPSDRIPLELMTGFEPVTSSLPRTRSTC